MLCWTIKNPFQEEGCIPPVAPSSRRSPLAGSPLWELSWLKGTILPKVSPSRGSLHPMANPTWEHKVLAPSLQFRTALWGCWGFCWNCIASQPVPLPNLLSTPHFHWHQSQEHCMMNFLQANLKICLLRNLALNACRQEKHPGGLSFRDKKWDRQTKSMCDSFQGSTYVKTRELKDLAQVSRVPSSFPVPSRPI